MDHIPDYILRQIQEHHGWSVQDWLRFSYSPLPNNFTMIFLFIIALTLGNRFWWSPSDDMMSAAFNAAIDILFVDIVIYKWFTNVRCLVGLKKFKAGVPWKNIKSYEVDMG